MRKFTLYIVFSLIVGVLSAANGGLNVNSVSVGGHSLEQLDDDFFFEMGCRGDSGSVDIVFCIDSTGSMSGTISGVRTNISDFVDALVAGGYNYRLGAVTYGDGTNVWDFDPTWPGNQMTDDAALFQSWLSGVGASGGGDFPELSFDAIADAIRLIAWRPTALHVIILFTDAPAHEIGDGTPFSDETGTGVFGLVMSTGMIVFIMSPTAGDPDYVTYTNIATSSGGQHYPLGTSWSVIFPDVVGYIGSSAVININATNNTGTFIDTVYATLITGDCLTIASWDTVRIVYAPDGYTCHFGWRVNVDPTCVGSGQCFTAIVWSDDHIYSDSVYGCNTNEDCIPTHPTAAIVRPMVGVFDACPGDSIIIDIRDSLGIDTMTIRVVLERSGASNKTYTVDTIGVYYNVIDSILVLHPSPPLIDGEAVEVTLTEVENIVGGPLAEPLNWTFYVDFTPPVAEYIEPPCSTIISTMTPDSIAIRLYDATSGVDRDNLYIVVDGVNYPLRDPAVRFDPIDSLFVFYPLVAGLSWRGGEWIHLSLYTADRADTDYCGPNDTVYNCDIQVEPGGPRPVIVRPLPNTYSSCPDEHIEIRLTDPDGLMMDSIAIRVNGETIRWGDSRLLYDYTDSILYFQPSPPFQDGEVVSVEFVSAFDSLLNPAEDYPVWSFTMDISPPWFTLTVPPETLVTTVDMQQPIQIELGDNISGLDTATVVFKLAGRVLPRDHYSLAPYAARYILVFSPAAIDTHYLESDSVCFEIDATDSTDYCDDNVGAYWHCFMIEISPGCDHQPNPFTPNGDGTNDIIMFQYPRMYSRDAVLTVFSKRRELVYRRNMPPSMSELDYKNRIWDGRDKNGRVVPAGLYIYTIEQGGELICEGTITVVR